SVAYHMGQLFIDSCTGHNITPLLCRALAIANVEIHDFPPNSTHLCQLTDQWPIQKIKEHWTHIWNAKKLDMLEKEDVSEVSGKLNNLGKPFFLKTAAKAVLDANKATDLNGMNYARKSMIRCGLSLDNGNWMEEMLSKPFQEIINKFRKNFDGKPVDEVVEDGDAASEDGVG
ncbi:hypothetical protein HDU79_010141, partial [Rhizoclosmatium sp. JEL0117]